MINFNHRWQQSGHFLLQARAIFSNIWKRAGETHPLSPLVTGETSGRPPLPPSSWETPPPPSSYAPDAENNWLKVSIPLSFNVREVYELMLCGDCITFLWIMNSSSSSTVSSISLIKEKVSKQMHRILPIYLTTKKQPWWWSWK